MNRKQRLAYARERITETLDQLHREVFTSDMKLTFIARDPANEDCTLILSDDDLDGVQGAIRYLVEHGEDRG